MPAPSASSPERRSAADLQRILDSLIGDAGFVLSGDLPDVLIAYEEKHDLVILDPSEYQGLRELCRTHNDMELGPTELFTFLSMIQKPQPRSSSPVSSSLTHSASMPPSSFQAYDQSTPKQSTKSGNRRHSDRIRSPSDSSSSSSEGESADIARRRIDRQKSEPTQGRAFPSSASAIHIPNIRPLPPKRTKTLSDPSRNNGSPLAMRATRAGAGPPSAFGSIGGFARPSPASRRRRGSSGAYTSENEEARSPSYGQTRFERSTSSTSLARSVTSPTWQRNEDNLSSPISPGVDHTSFHIRAKSPEEDVREEELAAAEEDLRGEEGSVNGLQDELEETDDVVGEGLLGMGSEALNPRLSRISAESTTSLRTSHDKLQLLQKQNAELSRKLKDSERQLSLLGADNDRMVVDLERQLEEARHELAQKRKEDKELRGNELKQNIQISGLEADLANVQRSLEQSKEHRANMQKMYDSQCDEAQRLRDMLRDRDAEIHQLEESMQEHEADEEKFNREVQSLEAEVKRLESDLAVARRAESVLETQKQENLQLKETIDRMRFDLDEARAAAANNLKSGHGRISTNGSSAGGTLSRNLGDEINRRLVDAEAVHEGEEGDGESYVETVVTTQRTRKVGSRAPSASQGSGSANVAAIQIEDEVREYADVSTVTDPVAVVPITGPSNLSGSPHEHPPAYTAQPEPINAQEILDRAHPREEGEAGIVDEEYDVMVETLGIRCNVLEEELKNRKVEREKLGLVAPLTSRRRSYLTERRHAYSKAGVINNIIYTTQDNMGKIAVWTVAAFAIGIVAGAHLAHIPQGIHPRDYQMFAHMNDLARSAGAGEGIMPHGARSLVGILGMGAGVIGRIPT